MFIANFKLNPVRPSTESKHSERSDGGYVKARPVMKGTVLLRDKFLCHVTPARCLSLGAFTLPAGFATLVLRTSRLAVFPLLVRSE